MQLRIDSGDGAGERVEVTGDRLVIGRDEACDIRFDETKVSRQHAEIVRNGNGYEVRDLGSSNGTYVGNLRLGAPRGLKDGDVLRIAGHRITVELEEPGKTELDTPPTQTERSRTAIQGATTMFRDLSRQMRLVAIGAGVVALIAIVVAVLALTGTFSKDEPTAADASRIAAPSTVQINGSVASGTGWVFDAARGLIVTNAHVINGNPKLTVAFRGKAQPARIVGVAACEDMAVLQIQRPPAGMRSIKQLPRQSMLSPGQTVVTIGYPGTFSSRSPLVTDAGVVSVVQTRADSSDFTDNHFGMSYPNLIQTDAAINHGNSGGPMVDLKGRLVGISTLTGGAIEGPLSNANGIKDQQNYAIGIDRVHQVVPLLASGRSLGFMGAFLEFRPGDYPLVSEVVPGSSAARAGIQKGDVLEGLDGRDIANDITEAGWCKRVRNRTGGEQSSLFVARGENAPAERITVAF